MVGGAADFPTVAATNSSQENTSTTSHTVNLPASIAAGDLLLIIWQSSSPSVTTPSGWNLLSPTPTTNGSNIQLIVYWKVASGSEGATQAITTGANTPAAHVSYRITGYQGTPEVLAATGTDTTPNPPSLSPSWGYDKTLWIAISDSARAGAAHSVSATPSGYSDVVSSSMDLATNTSYRLWTLRKQAEAASENPGSFTISNSLDWAAATLAIHGA